MKTKKLLISLLTFCSLLVVGCANTQESTNQITSATTSQILTTSKPTTVTITTNLGVEKIPHVDPTFETTGIFYEYNEDGSIKNQTTLPILNDKNYNCVDNGTEVIFTHEATGYSIIKQVKSQLTIGSETINDITCRFKTVETLKITFDEKNNTFIITSDEDTSVGAIDGPNVKFLGKGKLTINGYIHVNDFFISSDSTLLLNYTSGGAVKCANVEFQAGSKFDIIGAFGKRNNAINIENNVAIETYFKAFGELNITNTSESREATAIILVNSGSILTGTFYFEETTNITITGFDYGIGTWGRTIYVEGDIAKVTLVDCRNTHNY